MLKRFENYWIVKIMGLVLIIYGFFELFPKLYFSEPVATFMKANVCSTDEIYVAASDSIRVTRREFANSRIQPSEFAESLKHDLAAIEASSKCWGHAHSDRLYEAGIHFICIDGGSNLIVPNAIAKGNELIAAAEKAGSGEAREFLNDPIFRQNVCGLAEQ